MAGAQAQQAEVPLILSPSLSISFSLSPSAILFLILLNYLPTLLLLPLSPLFLLLPSLPSQLKAALLPLLQSVKLMASTPSVHSVIEVKEMAEKLQTATQVLFSSLKPSLKRTRVEKVERAIGRTQYANSLLNPQPMNVLQGEGEGRRKKRERERRRELRERGKGGRERREIHEVGNVYF